MNGFRWIAVLLAALGAGYAWGGAAGRADAAVTWGSPQLIDGTPPLSHTADITTALTCTSEPFCLGVAGGDEIVASLHPTGGTGAWVVTDVSRVAGYSNAGLIAAGCASAQWCAAADAAGELLTSADPSAPAPVWTASPAPSGIAALACPAAGECVAVTRQRVWQTSDASGGLGAWHPVGLPHPAHPLELTGVECAGPQLCVVSGEQENLAQSHDWGAELISSTAPFAAGRAWRAVHTPGFDGPEQPGSAVLTCASAHWCALMGGRSPQVLISHDPSGGQHAWRPVASTPLMSLVCPSPTECVSTHRDGILSTSHLTAGRRAWQNVVPDPYPNVTYGSGVACASVSLCVIGGDDSVLLAAQNPVGPASAWAPATLGLGYDALTGVSCVPGSCLAVDDADHLLVSSDPASGQWSVKVAPGPAHGRSGAVGVGLYATTGFDDAVSCTTGQLCGVTTGDELSVSTAGPDGPWTTHPIPAGPGGSAYRAASSVACLSSGCAVGEYNGDAAFVPAESGRPASSGLAVPDCVHGRGASCQYFALSVSCGDDTFCGAAASVSGAARFWVTQTPSQARWSARPISLPRDPDPTGVPSLACPAANVCAVALGDTVAVTTDAQDAAPHWSTSTLTAAGAVQLSGISCSSATACVAVDRNHGEAFAGNPAAGTWTPAELAPPSPDDVDGPLALTGVSCGLGTGCVAIDGTGHAIFGTVS